MKVYSKILLLPLDMKTTPLLKAVLASPKSGPNPCPAEPGYTLPLQTV